MKKQIICCGLGALGLSVIGWIVSNIESWKSVFFFMFEDAGFQIPYALLGGVWAMWLLYLIFMLIFFRKSKKKKNQNDNTTPPPPSSNNPPSKINKQPFFYDQVQDPTINQK